MKKNFLMWSFAMALLTGTLCTSCDETEGAVAPEETQSVQKGIAITYLHVTDQIMKKQRCHPWRKLFGKWRVRYFRRYS